MIGVESVSVDVDASAVTASGDTPEVGLAVRRAVGGWSPTVTRAVDVEAFPAVSLTVTVNVYVPAAPYVCPAVAVDCGGDVDVVPSPQSQAYVAIGVASPSVDADASAVTASGAVPELGLTVTL